MSHWGREIQVGKARFVTHVATRGFDPIRPDSPVDMVMLLDNGGDLEAAEKTLADLEAKMIGQPYDAIDALLPQPRSPSL